MRRVTRLRQPRLLLPSTPASAPCLRTISTSAPRSEDAPKRNRIREALWKGPAPGPADPYAQPASREYSEEQRELEAYEAELAALEAHEFDYGTADGEARPGRPSSRLKTRYKRSVAPKEREAQGGYSPATSGEGLEEVGGLDGWWDRPGHWGPESVYTGFAPADKVTSPAVLEVLVRQAVVEAVAVHQQQGKEDMLLQAWAEGDRAALDRALAADLFFASNGTVITRNSKGIVGALKPKPGTEKAVAKARRAVAAARAAGEEPSADDLAKAATFQLTPDEAVELLKTGDKTWKNVPLADPGLRFAVGKRVFQLTGHLIPDPKLARVETAAQLLSIVVRPPPPKKVYEQLVLDGELGLPNVQVHPRRQTPIDKEKAVGRWKLIVKELEARGLPVTGHKDYEPHRETNWTKGGV